jgi:tight adherence protein B
LTKAGRRIRLVALTAVLTTAAGAGPATAADELKLSIAQGSKFPDRSLVLSLPKARALAPDDVTLSENGEVVSGLDVTPASAAKARTFGVVIAIDASESMHDEAILGAMQAARTFAAARPEGQSLGVIFFSREHRIGLPLTTDRAKIDAVLGSVPPLSQGTRLNDAAAAGIVMLKKAQVRAGSVVVLSDGADVGSALTTSAVGEASRRAHVRIFTVGLRSPSYDGSTLRDLAGIGGGRYAEAGSAAKLAAVFDDLAQRLAAEYLVSYRSLAVVGSRVEVEATVNAVPGTASAGYTAPKLPTLAVPPVTRTESWWTTNVALAAVCLLCALLIAWALFLTIRPGRRTVHDRVDAFVGVSAEALPVLSGRQAASVLASAERSFARARWWPALVLDFEAARVAASPTTIALVTLLGSAVTAWALATVGQVVLAIAVLIGGPIVVRRFVAWLAARRRRDFADQLVDNLQVIVSAMRAGYSFAGALAVAVDDASEPVRGEFRRIVQDEKLGIPIEQAMKDVARRMQSADLEHVGLVAALQRETGGNTAEVLDRLIESVRGRTELRLLVRTLTAQGRISGVVVSLLPPGVVIIMSAMQPGYLSPLTDSPGGVLVLAAAGAAVLAGWLLIRRIVEIKV